MFSQSYSLYKYTVTYAYLAMLSKKSNFTNFVGVNKYALTYFHLKQRHHRPTLGVVYPLSPDQSLKTTLTRYAYFNSLNSLEKLTSLGFPFTTSIVDNQHFTTNSLRLFQNPPHKTNTQTHLFLKKLILSQCVTVKKIHTLLTLLAATNIQLHKC
jgi:hypothetical protein